MKLRVLHISARADHSGGPRHLHDLAKAGLAQRMELLIACPREHPFWDRYGSIVGVGNMFEIPHRRFSISALRGLADLVRRRQIHVLHSHGRGAGIYTRLLGRLLRFPVVHTFHGLGPALPLWRLWEERLLAGWSTRVIAVSQSEALSVQRQRIGRAEQLRLIPNSVEGASHSSTTQSPVSQVVSIMRLAPEKNPQLFVEIAHRLLEEHPEIRWRILGSGPLLNETRAQAPSTVEFLGAVDEPRTWLAQPGTIYLSTSRTEGMSLALLDAMALGCPVVATAVPGNIDLIRDGETGLLFPSGDAEAGAAAVRRLISDSGLCSDLAKNASSHVARHHSLTGSVDALMSLYSELGI